MVGSLFQEMQTIHAIFGIVFFKNSLHSKKYHECWEDCCQFGASCVHWWSKEAES